MGLATLFLPPSKAGRHWERLSTLSPPPLLFRTFGRISLSSTGRASHRAIPPGSPDGGAKRRMRRTTRAAHLSRFSAPLWPLSSVVFTVAAVKTMVFRMAAVRRRTFLLCVRREQGAIAARLLYNLLNVSDMILQ